MPATRRPNDKGLGTGNRRREPRTASDEAKCAELESLYKAGRYREVISQSDDYEGDSTETAVRTTLARGMAFFDVGDACTSIECLRHAIEISTDCPPGLQFSGVFSLFVRESDFQSPTEVLPGLARLRQLAASIGDPQSLAGLHLAVARLEGSRGNCIGAHRHVELARTLARP